MLTDCQKGGYWLSGEQAADKNTQPRWRLDNQQGNQLIGCPRDLQQVEGQISLCLTSLPFIVARWRPDAAAVCPLSVLCNSTSKRLITELIRANPVWGNAKLDLSWLLRDVFMLLEEKVWRKLMPHQSDSQIVSKRPKPSFAHHLFNVSLRGACITTAF